MTTSPSETPSARSSQPSLRAFAASHKRLTFGGLAVLILLTAALVFGTLGARLSRVSDTTSCSGWSAATQAQQKAYAGLYVREHGLLGGTRNAAGVEQAIDTGCIKAFSFDEADTVSVVQAAKAQY
jgi:hypothetical protein